jgi:hypothetical protein
MHRSQGLAAALELHCMHDSDDNPAVRKIEGTLPEYSCSNTALNDTSNGIV